MIGNIRSRVHPHWDRFKSYLPFRGCRKPDQGRELYLDTSDETIREEQKLHAACRSLKEEITTYRDTVKKIDELILEFPELTELFQTYMEKHPESIVNI